MKRLVLISLIIVLISFGIGIYSYFHFPDLIDSHWNSNGMVDGHTPKFWGLFLIPLISLGLLLLFSLIPTIDPLKKNIEKFRNYYDSFILIFVVFLFYIYLLRIVWNFKIRFNMNTALIPAFGFLFFYIGIILKYTKRNWFIGIRTPWTLSSEKVWDKTHKLGSTLFKISGIITVIGIFFENYILWFVLLPVIISVVILVIYSYLEYRKEKK